MQEQTNMLLYAIEPLNSRIDGIAKCIENILYSGHGAAYDDSPLRFAGRALYRDAEV